MTPIDPMPERSAHVVYDTLVEHAGASEYWRKQFVLTLTTACCAEFKFRGFLGIDATFRRTVGERADGSIGEIWSVDCEACDSTPERVEAISRTNATLAALQNIRALVPSLPRH